MSRHRKRKQGPDGAAHGEGRKRTEGAVRELDPDIWARFLLRRRQGEVSQYKEEIPADPEVRDDDDEQGSLYGGLEHRDLDEVASPHPI